jgi:hypothetical protein
LDDPSIGALFGATIVLVILSAYFSGSETAMMALNRYRLKHLANEGHGGARRASRLLERPDRLLSVILIGNNLVNFTAASLATLIALELYGESWSRYCPCGLYICLSDFRRGSTKIYRGGPPGKSGATFVLYPQFALAKPLSTGVACQRYR